MKLSEEFLKGIWKENPVLVLILGMCPSLATSSNAVNGMGMGLATTFVLLCSNVVISAVRNIVPAKIRIPCYIVVIATFVTVVDLLMQAYTQSLYNALGIFIPLIVVNCIVLGRAEAFASKNTMLYSAMDGLGMGIGFTLALTFIGLIREFLAAGTLFDIKIISAWQGFSVMGQAPGGFIVMGFILAGMNFYNMRRAARAGKTYDLPQELDCRHCNICHLGTSRTRIIDHGMQHLCSHNYRLLSQNTLANEYALNTRNAFLSYLNTQITTSHHDTVSHFQNFVDVIHTLLIFYLGNDTNVAMMFIQYSFNIKDILLVAHKRMSNKIDIFFNRI